MVSCRQHQSIVSEVPNFTPCYADIFPGPTVEARSGDTLIISVKNGLQEESISIHWHGLHMRSKTGGS